MERIVTDTATPSTIRFLFPEISLNTKIPQSAPIKPGPAVTIGKVIGKPSSPLAVNHAINATPRIAPDRVAGSTLSALMKGLEPRKW